MPEEALPHSLQESLLALLAFNDGYGASVASQVRPEHFDQPYQEIATKLLSYRQAYGRPPGITHLDDIFGWALEKGDRATRLRRLLAGITELNKGLNVEYIASKTSLHIRKQTLKAAILRAGELYQQGGDDNVDQVEQVLFAALRSRQQNLTAGIFLSDIERGLKFLERTTSTYALNIKQLDEIQLGLSAGEQLLYIAPKNSGKSWFCVHCGRQGLINRGRVLHISLEMDENLVYGRYVQSYFGAASRNPIFAQTLFEYDELGRLTGWRTAKRRANLSFRDPNIRKILKDKLTRWGIRFGSLLIKRFPNGQLTVPSLVAYLDYLESVHNFVPTILIVDYPDLMRIDPRNYRHELGRICVDLLGLAVERNMALVTPTQGGRATIGARRVRSNMVAEDISKVFTADNVLTYSQTEGELARGMARLHVDHARNTERGLELVITQAYSVGQYVMESAFMSSAYWEQMKLATEDEGEED